MLWGMFESTNPVAEKKVEAAAKDQEEDEFGDFADFPDDQAVKEPVSDGFGDFGAFEGNTEQNQDKAATTSTTIDMQPKPKETTIDFLNDQKEQKNNLMIDPFSSIIQENLKNLVNES